ncbi:MAG: hypothetical protein LBE75_09550 [Burkholderiales bacterium]|jgi:hypothetical protein|nr:hypothetical protein [Burkholderiales bacterium]
MEEKICKLCGEKSCGKFPRSHIFPKAFFSMLPEKGNFDILGSEGTRTSISNGFHDDKLVCLECENKIFSPVDGYAVRLLRDREGRILDPTEFQDSNSTNCEAIVFEGVNRLEVRKFLASLLWRFSKSNVSILKFMSIGSKYEEQISRDLQCSTSNYDYIDALIFFVTDPVHAGFQCPIKEKIGFKKPHSQKVNGWMIGMPFIQMHVSLDQRPLPSFLREDTEYKNLALSTSLQSKHEGDLWLVPQYQKVEEIEHSMVKIYTQHETLRNAEQREREKQNAEGL